MNEQTVNTVLGPISAGEMGITSIHEHAAVDRWPSRFKESFDRCVAELKKAKALGMNTIVEVSPDRDVLSLKRISESSGVNIICSTGAYAIGKYQLQWTEDDFAAHMLREIDEGIQGSGIYPGVIKVRGDGVHIYGAQKNAFLAAAKVQRMKSIPICTHAVDGARAQSALLDEAGADMRHVYFSHVECVHTWEGRTVEEQIDYLAPICDKGSVLSFNNFGAPSLTKPDIFAALILGLIARGFVNSLAVTMDTVWLYPEGKLTLLWEKENAKGDGALRWYGYTLSHTLPWLRSIGVSEEDARKMIRDNPRRLFGW